MHMSLYGCRFSFLPDKCLWLWFTDPTISAHLTLWGIDELFHKVATPWHILISNVWNLPLFHRLGNISYLSDSYMYYYTCHSLACIVIFYCGFNLHFPNLNEVECLFMGWLATRIYSLVKCLFQSFLHFSIGLFDYCLVLYILDTRLLSGNIFQVFSYGPTLMEECFELGHGEYAWRQFLWEHIMSVSPSQTCSMWVEMVSAAECPKPSTVSGTLVMLNKYLFNKWVSE